MGTDDDMEAFAAIEREGALTARAHFAPLIPPADAPNVEAGRQAVAKLIATTKKYDEGALRPAPSISVHQAKLFMDGVINAPANTGALLEPYLVNHGTAQSPKFEPAAHREPATYFSIPVLTAILIDLGRNNIDPHLHTDGDGAVRAGLDAVQAMRAALPGKDVRPGFAHCELVDPDGLSALRATQCHPGPVLPVGKASRRHRRCRARLARTAALAACRARGLAGGEGCADRIWQ